MDIEKLKNDIALKHGYQDGILGSAWNFAMQLTHRTKRQIALYEEVIEALANSSDELSGLHKHVVNARFSDFDEDEEDYEEEEPDCKVCMCCGSVQQSGMSCNKCCGPTRDGFL